MYTIHIHDRLNDRVYEAQIPGDRYILEALEERGIELPFACRNGACTTCAVRVKTGDIYQPEAVGLSRRLQEKGYALLCSGYARSNLALETQDEDEVYQIQFGRYFQRQRKPWFGFGLPVGHDD